MMLQNPIYDFERLLSSMIEHPIIIHERLDLVSTEIAVSESSTNFDDFSQCLLVNRRFCVIGFVETGPLFGPYS